jgi:predicted metal-dependent hydrolase
VSRKSAKIATLIERCQGHGVDPHYFGYFECFNRGLFYEAHDVLEEMWLAERQGPNYAFYKGLIQFAGAFVHLQKNRLRPGAALFKLAHANLRLYPNVHERLDVALVLLDIEGWLRRLEAAGFQNNPLSEHVAPQLALLPEG